MLSFEHVRAKRKGEELVLQPLKAGLRERSLELAQALITTAQGSLGQPREELERAFRSIEVAARERRVFLGLTKLVEDSCEFEVASDLDPSALRSELFVLSAELRQRGEFSRTQVLERIGASRGVPPERVEAALYADLRGAHRLLACRATSAQHLLDDYERGQVQAVLLRAVKVIADVRCKAPDAYRVLFRKLKFRQLLHKISPLPAGGYRIEIDGPYSLFDSIAKYGLELALTLPALEACDELELAAMVQMKDGSAPLRFHHTARARRHEHGEPSLRDEVAELLTAINATDGGVRARVGEQILDLPGLGVCVPDLVLTVPGSSEPVYVEILGFWSRDSVWKRVELVERGLSAKVLFAVSSRLRVSEEVLGESESAALYVYRGRINPRALLRCALALAKGSA